VTEPRGLYSRVSRVNSAQCDPAKQKELRRIFEKEPFGELERLVTQKLRDVAQGVCKEELRSEEWLRLMAHSATAAMSKCAVPSSISWTQTSLKSLLKLHLLPGSDDRLLGYRP